MGMESRATGKISAVRYAYGLNQEFLVNQQQIAYQNMGAALAGAAIAASVIGGCISEQDRMRLKIERESRERYPLAWMLSDWCDEMISMCDEALKFNPLENEKRNMDRY